MSVAIELKTNGYSFRESNFVKNELGVSDDEVNIFCEEWNNLGPDNYLQGDYIFRQRRYGKIGFIPNANLLWKEDESDYFQSEAINTYAGGIHRKFSPLTEDIVNNKVFKKLIFDTFNQFSIESEYLDSEWCAEIHLFRLLVEADKDTCPTPEGIHRDGFPFGGLHLIARKNVEGAVSRVYSLDEQFLASTTLQNTLDTFYCVDNKVKHFTTPFYSSNSYPGYRDVLVYGFHLPGTKYQKA